MNPKDALTAWNKQKQYVQNQRQLATSGKKNAIGQLLGNKNASVGFAWGQMNALQQRVALARAQANMAKAGITTDANGRPVSNKGLTNFQPFLNGAQTMFPRKGAK